MNPALANLRRRVNRARDFPANTCGASRHVHEMAENFLRYGPHCMTQGDCDHVAESMLAVVESLWKLRSRELRRPAQ